MKRSPKKILAIAILGFTMALCFACDAFSADKCFGLYISDSPTDLEISKAAKLYGQTPCAMLLFYDATWFPSAAQLNTINNAGATPIITIEPWDAKTKEPKEIDEAYIKGLAASLNEYGQEAFIRFAHEMNGNWYPWSGDPERYIESYKRFHSQLSAALSNKNVKWIFSVNNTDSPDTQNNRAAKYYPGDEFVDMIGIDGYLNSPPWWQRIYLRFTGVAAALFGEQIDALRDLQKPVVISEIGISGDDDFKSWAIKSLFLELEEKYPEVSKLVWFDIKKEADWRIASGINSLESFKKGIKTWE